MNQVGCGKAPFKAVARGLREVIYCAVSATYSAMSSVELANSSAADAD